MPSASLGNVTSVEKRVYCRTIASLTAAVVLAGCANEWALDREQLRRESLAVGTQVEPINWGTFQTAAPLDCDSIRARDVLLNTNRYSLTHWYQPLAYIFEAGVPFDFLANTEHRVRPAASVAMALAVSLQLGIYDPIEVTVPRATAEAIALKLIRSLARRHLANGGKWGHKWQSALWTLYAGTAGWLMWDKLSATDAEYVRRMVEDEAIRLVGYDVEYYRDANDKPTNRDEQSAQEEDAWNAQFLFLAVNMMPNHPQRAAWEYKAAELSVSANARVVDRQSNSTLVSGRQVRHWLHGSNVEFDGTVINHDRVHPDYMATAAYTASAPLWYGLRRRFTPDAMLFGADKIYEALIERSLNGGTIYIDRSGVIFYPVINDWGSFRRINFGLFDTVARHFQLDGQVEFIERAEVWEDLHMRAALDLQQRAGNESGRTYLNSSEDTYQTREEWVAAHAALVYLTKWIVAQNAFSTTPAFLPVVIDNQDDREMTGIEDWIWDAPAAKDSLGDDNRYAPKGDGSRKVRFRPRLPAGTYRVSAWWSAFGNHATDAPYTIYHTGGQAVERRNQRINGKRWNVLGTFTFDGTSNTGFVELSNDANGYVVTDGVMFERL